MKKLNGTISLNLSRAGQWLQIISIPEGKLHAQFVRLGVHEGEKVKCIERLAGGTVVLQKNRQHIAVGHQLASQITAAVLGESES